MAEMEDHTDDILNEVDRLISQNLVTAALLVERTAKSHGYCPVLTGTARRSITHEPQVPKREVRVGSNIEYFPYIELGTSKMAARAPLRRALEANKAALKRLFKVK